MTTRAQFQAGAQEKLADARTLFDAGAYANAYYLAGYAVELGLKAVIARRFVSDDVPDLSLVKAVYTHRLTQLIGVAQLQTTLTEGSPELQAKWIVAAAWSEQTRYEARSREDADDLLKAVGDPADGVLTWLKTLW